MTNSMDYKLGANKTTMVKVGEDGKLAIPSAIKKPEIGDKVLVAGIAWTILDITEEGYSCIADSIGDKQFDRKCNDWKKSDLREYLNREYLAKLEANVGPDNIIPFERDLLSLDGQTEYGTCTDKVSLLTVDEYRKYRSLLPNTRDWWWLITPDSTACNDDSTWGAVVSPLGIFRRSFYYNRGGVRPVCIFSSAIFESEEE